jgi:hypothetical protein
MSILFAKAESIPSFPKQFQQKCVAVLRPELR